MLTKRIKICRHCKREFIPDKPNSTVCNSCKKGDENSIFNCDFNKFTGVSYENLGMKFIDYTVPDMKWIIEGKVVSRNPKKHHELKHLADAQIFGVGSKKYLWEKHSSE